MIWLNKRLTLPKLCQFIYQLHPFSKNLNLLMLKKKLSKLINALSLI